MHPRCALVTDRHTISVFLPSYGDTKDPCVSLSWLWVTWIPPTCTSSDALAHSRVPKHTHAQQPLPTEHLSHLNGNNGDIYSTILFPTRPGFLPQSLRHGRWLPTMASSLRERRAVRNRKRDADVTPVSEALWSLRNNNRGLGLWRQHSCKGKDRGRD